MAEKSEGEAARSAVLQSAQSPFLASQHSEREWIEALERKSEEIAQQREWFQVTLSSIGDAVITTDTEARVTFLNPVAEALTGWKSAKADRQPLERIFNIISEETRQPAPNPIGRVLREGVIVRLANHTVLVARDGTETPVEDSAAPIRDASGTIVGAVMVFHDVTQRRRTERALRRVQEAHAQLAAVVKFSDDAIVTKTLDGVITTWNAGAERIFGYSAEEMIGQPITRIIPADRQSEERDILRRLRAGEHIDHYETVRVTKDGRSIDMSLTVSPLRDPTGAIIGASKIARDITQRKRFEAEVRAARDAAEAANRTKDEFLAALSHELRTPLAPVLMLAADMEHAEELPEAVRADFAMIRKNVELEARIIDDLLDLTRITRGKLTLRSETVDVHALIEHALSILRSQQAAKNLDVTLDLGAAEPHVSGDAVRLQQVCWNVIKNAIKFTPPGGRISIRSWNEQGQLRVAVADTGLGITAEEMPRIFTAFEQGSEARTHFGGLGPGLSIAAVLVREQDGRIWAESAGRNQGSTFYLELPLAAAPAPATPEAPRLSSPAGASLRILLVEDHEDSRCVLVRLMTRWGHRVTAAASVAQAREEIASGTFDLVLSDLGLPDGAGFEVVRTVRERSGIPVIAMSGYGMEADLAHSQAAGFAHHIVKPVSADRLRELLAQFAPTSGNSG